MRMQIWDDTQMLNLMIADSLLVESIYQPGPYWKSKTRSAAKQAAKFGIGDFRGASNIVGLSFTDSVLLDLTTTAATPMGFVAAWLLKSTPLRRKFDAQVQSTRDYWDKYRLLRNLLWLQSGRVSDLLDRYRVSETVSAGCIDTIEIGGQVISAHYLQLLDTHDRLAQEVDYDAVTSLLEIGGGFGANVHLLISNYPMMRKFLYLDIVPNLYVGTQYLRSIFGDSVRSYRELRGLQAIRFRDDSDLEILCIAPHQLQAYEGKVDLVHNAHSFVEMPRDVVANYAKLSGAILASPGTVTMVSYDGFDVATFDPNELPTFFMCEFTHSMVPKLTPGRFNYQFVGHS